jgi:hypothetical protein
VTATLEQLRFAHRRMLGRVDAAMRITAAMRGAR